MKNRLRPVLTIATIIFIAAIIIYPKIKDMNLKGGKGKPAQGQGMMRSSQQTLNVSGLVVQPSTITEYVNSTGTLMPDEEVELLLKLREKLCRYSSKREPM
ncbi:MAG: hypothetical protein R2744_00430 [Bacteroidales bacterium]